MNTTLRANHCPRFRDQVVRAKQLRVASSNRTNFPAGPPSGEQSFTEQSNTVTMTILRSTSRFAYLFYATNDEYAVAALVAIALLKQLHVRDDIDFVVLHLRIAHHILATMQRMGVFAEHVERLPPAYPHWFKDSLTKLRVFQLVQYERVVFLDADTIPLVNLDHLFDLDFRVYDLWKRWWLAREEVMAGGSVISRFRYACLKPMPS